LEKKSLQSSIQRHFGLAVEDGKIPSKERGMGDLMCLVYDTYDQILTHEMLYKWRKLIMQDNFKISDIGKYRTHKDPMRIVSGRYDDQKVYFEAPPSANVYKEMTKFIKWFNDSKNKTSVLARAAIAHIYFETIHPFEDGNGRVGRAIVEKSLSQSLEKRALISISQIITKRKKEYYAKLCECNKTLNIGRWVIFFAEVIVQAQEESFSLINFLMAKSKLMNELKSKINQRQEKVLLRMFEEGIKGFSGGLSAENYISITKTSKATATV
jgi:Fic family protein